MPIWIGIEGEYFFKSCLRFGHNGTIGVICRGGKGRKGGFNCLKVLAAIVLVERLGSEAFRFRDECRLAGLVKLEGEDADGGDGEGCCRGREGHAPALTGSLALAEIVVAWS